MHLLREREEIPLGNIHYHPLHLPQRLPAVHPQDREELSQRQEMTAFSYYNRKKDLSKGKVHINRFCVFCQEFTILKEGLCQYFHRHKQNPPVKKGGKSYQ